MSTAVHTAAPAGTEEIPEHLQLLEQAIVAVESDEGFQAWLAFRSRFHNYSLFNQLMIAMQFPDATFVAGYKAWQKKHGRQVVKGAKGIMILAPMIHRYKAEDPETGEETTGRRVFGFRGARVFDVSQTTGEPLPTPPPPAKLDGDSHAHLIPELIAHANELGYEVSITTIPGSAKGFCNPTQKLIAISEDEAPNAQVRILVHELIHAHGTSYEEFGRALAETITDSATYVACKSLGLDVLDVVSRYVAGWSDRELRQRALGYIDYYAAAIERACGLHERVPALPQPSDANTTAQEAA